jgi:NmrA-like family
MSNENVVLVTGGTGSQGGATVTHLLAAKKVRVRVPTRNLESPKAKCLAARGVELVKGDFEDVASLRTALAGVSAAFSVQQWWTEKGGPAAEELNGKRFADAVKASGSPHLVYSSAEGVERKSGLGHYESKWAIEQHIRDLKRFCVRSDSWMRLAPQRCSAECSSECSERTLDFHTASNSWPPTTSVGLPRARSKIQSATPDALSRSPGTS